MVLLSCLWIGVGIMRELAWQSSHHPCQSLKKTVKFPYFPQKPVEISDGMCYDYPV